VTYEQQKSSRKRNDSKTLLTSLKLTATVGAVSLTLAGWGLLSAAEARNATVDPLPSTAFLSAAPAVAASQPTNEVASIAQSAPVQNLAESAVQSVAPADSTGNTNAVPTVTTESIAAAEPTATPAPTATPEALFTLDIVQWTESQTGEPMAVVQDENGTLWYVLGTDIPLIEQGLEPAMEPQPVNSRGRSRGS